MENNQDHLNIDEEKKNVMLKYLKVVLFRNPFYHYFQYGNKINTIFEELDKTGLPKVIENQDIIATIQFHSTIESSLGFFLSSFFLFKIKKISLLNRCFLIAVFSTALFYLIELRKKDKILDKILFSMTHYGQEARILTKFYLPNHRRIVGIQNRIDLFRENAEKKQMELIKKKEIIEKIIEKEKKEDEKFLEEVSKDFESDDFGKNL